MYVIMADYGFMCRFASHLKFKNVLEAKEHMEELRKNDSYLAQNTYNIEYFVIHESEVENEFY